MKLDKRTQPPPQTDHGAALMVEMNDGRRRQVVALVPGVRDALTVVGVDVVGQPPVKPADTTKPLATKPMTGDPLTDPGNILSRRSIFFDYDSNLIKDEFKPIVTAHARYLQQNPSTRIRVEGNADERGSREYNIALGQRRADAVSQAMQLLGAQASQIETVSFGEEKPKAVGHDEKSWAENRRADIVYRSGGDLCDGGDIVKKGS